MNKSTSDGIDGKFNGEEFYLGTDAVRKAEEAARILEGMPLHYMGLPRTETPLQLHIEKIVTNGQGYLPQPNETDMFGHWPMPYGMKQLSAEERHSLAQNMLLQKGE